MAKVNQMTPLSGQPNRFSFHIEMSEKRCRLGPGTQSASGLKLLLSHGFALGYASIYSLFDGFGDPSGWSSDWVLSGSWSSGTCLSVTPESCFMILLPEGGSLFEITSFP